METMHRRLFRATLILLATASGPGPMGAQVPEPRPLVMTAENLMAHDARHRERPGAALPGDVIRYRITFTNVRTDSIRNVRFTDPIPPGLRYLAGSAGADREDVTIEFSIDGGASWSPQPMIEEVVEGRPVRRPAPPALYTNVRWSVRGWLKPNAQVTAELRAQLPEGAPKP